MRVIRDGMYQTLAMIYGVGAKGPEAACRRQCRYNRLRRLSCAVVVERRSCNLPITLKFEVIALGLRRQPLAVAVVSLSRVPVWQKHLDCEVKRDFLCPSETKRISFEAAHHRVRPLISCSCHGRNQMCPLSWLPTLSRRACLLFETKIAESSPSYPDLQFDQSCDVVYNMARRSNPCEDILCIHVTFTSPVTKHTNHSCSFNAACR